MQCQCVFYSYTLYKLYSVSVCFIATLCISQCIFRSYTLYDLYNQCKIFHNNTLYKLYIHIKGQVNTQVRLEFNHKIGLVFSRPTLTTRPTGQQF